MALEEVLNEANSKIRRIIPEHISVTDIDMEGPNIIIYTKDFDELLNTPDILKLMAQSLKRRVVIRQDPSLLMEEEKAEQFIREHAPKDSVITYVWFEDNGEVYIETKQPELFNEDVLKEIHEKIGWTPRVTLTPPMPSKTITDIRNYLKHIHDERKEFLKKLSKKICKNRIDDERIIRITTLGAYREVGRSATLVMTKESKVLIDCGLSSMDNYAAGTPYLNIPEVLPFTSIDAVIVTHAHLDHSGLVPALFKYGYTGPVYCTPPTRDLMSLLQIDMLKVAHSEGKKVPYDSSHIRDMIRNCITLKYGETTDITPDIRITFHNAGHILGSALVHLHIGEGIYNIVFTGDIKFEKTWLFNPAISKFPRIETLVIESTYGGHHDLQPSRDEATERLKEVITTTLTRGGKVLIPVFAVGRSQEVMIAIEKLMREEGLPRVPVYLDGLIYEATAIHTAYPEYLNSNLRNDIFQKGFNPFLSDIFLRVENMDARLRICDEPDSCIVLATSGMMVGGPVMEYFKHWASNEKHQLIFVGFQSEGTLGRKIQRGLSEITVSNRNRQESIPIRMQIETIDGFSGHSDRNQLLGYLSAMNPKPERIIIGHGDEYKCVELASAIYKKFGIDTRVPLNLETVRLK